MSRIAPSSPRGPNPRSSSSRTTCSRARSGARSDAPGEPVAPRPRARPRPHSSPASSAVARGDVLERATASARTAASAAYSETSGSVAVGAYSQAGRPRPSGAARVRATSPRRTSDSRCWRTVLACKPDARTSAAW